MKIKDLRKDLDIIDQELMRLLERRFTISKEIGKRKLSLGLSIKNKNRENEIKSRFSNCQYNLEIRQIYNQIFSLSKQLQNYDYFLVGNNIEHSYSPIIYHLFGLEFYNLYETLDISFIKDIEFKGINVTIPFKYDAYQLVDELAPCAKTTKVVNTIIKEDKKLIGYNTDLFGFKELLIYYNIGIDNQNILIIGNGATANTVAAVIKEFKPLAVNCLVRTIRNNNEYKIENYKTFVESNIIINTTPYGQVEEEPLFPLDDFSKLKAVIDVIYNPCLSPLLKAAKRKNIPVYNGLYMLVAQAAASYEIYTKQTCYNNIEKVYKYLKNKQTNIILIGMPYAGKTTTGKYLSGVENRVFIDIDEVLEKNNITLNTVSEQEFRRNEAQKTIEASKNNGLVIATGGGVIYNNEVMINLQENGIIIFLDIPYEILKSRLDNTRPLVKSSADLKRLYEERYKIYYKYADIIVQNNNLKELRGKINEYFYNKWTKS